LNYEFDLFG
jgi:hypothetical protein